MARRGGTGLAKHEVRSRDLCTRATQSAAKSVRLTGLFWTATKDPRA